MKILIISRGYPTKKYLGNGIFEFDQAKALTQAGQEVIFAAVDMRSLRRWRKWGIEKLDKDGVTVYGINYPLGRIPKKMLSYFTIRGLKRLYKKIEKESGKPDIMHTHFMGMGLAGVELKKEKDIPLVMTEHSSGLMSESIDKKLLDKGKQVYPNIDRIITVSSSLRQVLKNTFNADSIYIPNIVDTNSFQYNPQRGENGFSFITVGGLIYRKRMDLTIEAFAQSFSDNEYVRLIIIGEGPERIKLENAIKRCGLQDRIKLTGLLDRKEISKYMNQSHCFVLPSRAETFGVVYIEAMATGLPVIATRCGGPEGFVNDSNGIMINVDDLNALASAMMRMYKGDIEFDNMVIAKKTRDAFSPKIIAKQLIELYENVLEGKSNECN